MQPNRVGYTHWGRRYDDEYVVGPFAGIFPTKEPPSYWRSMADQSRNLAIPSWACKVLPRWVRAIIGANCTFGAVYDAVSKKALKRWRKASHKEKQIAEAKAEQTVRNLVRLERNLNGMRQTFKTVGKKYDVVTTTRNGRRQVDRSAWPAYANKAQSKFNTLNTTYKIMATQVYANSFEIDKKTGKQVLPGPAVDAASGLGFGLYEYDPDFTGSELDGEALGAAIATRVENEQFGNAFGAILTTGVVITGLIVLGVVGISFALAWREAAKKAARESDNELAALRLETQKDIAKDQTIDAATKQQLLQDIDVQQGRESALKKVSDEKSEAAEMLKVAMPYIIGIGAAGLLYKWVEARFLPSRSF